MKYITYLQQITGRLPATIHCKAIKYQKEKALYNTPLLLLVKGGFLKLGPYVCLKLDHVFNLLFCKAT